MDPSKLRDLVKRIPMAEVVEALGAGPIVNNKITSIYQEEKTPSLHVYTYDYFDFSTGRGGDQITFVMDYLHIGYGKALRFLTRLGDTSLPPRKRVEVNREVDLTQKFGARDSANEAEVELIEKLAERKWPTITLTEILLYSGSRVVKPGALWTPHYSWDRRRISGVKIRDWRGGKHAITGSIFSTQLYMMPYSRADEPSVIVIVEGESDTWALQKAVGWENGIYVLGLPAGAVSWRTEFYDYLPQTAEVFLALDDDPAGLRGAAAIAHDFAEHDRTIGYLLPPGGRVAEGLSSGWDPLSLLD